MKFSQKELIQIVEKSSTLYERISTKFIPHTIQDHHLIDTRLEKWCHVIAKGNKEKFKKYLEWQGVDVGKICNAVGAVNIADEQSLPGWTETLKQVIESAASSFEHVNSGNCSVLDPDEPLPFEEILTSFINVARTKLINRVGSNYQILSEDSHISLERSLLQRLATFSSLALELEFSVFRSFRKFGLFFRSENFQAKISKKKYTEFIKGLLQERLPAFFLEYSVLAKIMAIVTDFWVDSIEEFILRLVSDWSQIQKTFQENIDLGQVIAVKCSLSDPHNCGRSVIGIKFTSGLKLIYKPRDLSLEEAYFDLLSWLNNKGIYLSFKLLKVINHSTHGWVEFAETLPCQDYQETKRYYQRMGMLLGILYILRGTDCHYENLVVCGEHPVLIDMETLLHHRVWAVEPDADSSALANESLNDSVIGTHLLPRWEVNAEGQSYDLSPLRIIDEQENSYHSLQWQNINTDEMALVNKEVTTRQQPVQTTNHKANDYIEEIVDGFQQIYGFFEQHKEELLTAEYPLAKFTHQKVRLVFRNTRTYDTILRKSLDPKFLRDGADHSIELDVLGRAFILSDTKKPNWVLLKSERQAFEQFDIPYFTAYSHSNSLLISSQEIIENFFNETSFDAVISRLKQLNQADLNQQISFIRGSIYSCTPKEPHTTFIPKNWALDLNTVVPLTKEAMVQQAVMIAQKLKKQAIISVNGSATWFGMKYIRQARRFQLQPLGHNLYDGSCGIALFLAALGFVTGNSEFHDLALGTLHPLRKIFANLSPEYQQQITKETAIGGVTGLSSIIYGLVQISQLLKNTDLIKDAQRIAWLIEPQFNTTKQQKLDIVNDIIAAILSLLVLYEITGDPTVLMKATTWGEYLLNNYDYLSDQELIAGFAHNTVGIAYPMLRLYVLNQNSVFLEAAKKASSYEHSFLRSQSGNNNWPHGISALNLAHLNSLGILDRSDICQQHKVKLQVNQRFALQEIDNLCCGNFSFLEALIVASQQMIEPEFLNLAYKYATLILTRSEKEDCFRLLPNLHKNVYHPGFFQGTSGIGYELLRLAYPDLLPSVVLWQPAILEK